MLLVRFTEDNDAGMCQVEYRFSPGHVFTVRMFLARYIFKDSHAYILPFSWLPFTFLLVTVLTLPLRRYNLGDASLHLLVEVYV